MAHAHSPDSISSTSVMDKAAFPNDQTNYPVDKFENGRFPMSARDGSVAVPSAGTTTMQEYANHQHMGTDEVVMWPRVREFCQEFFSEFFGTFIMILFGDGVVAQVVLSGGTKGDYQSISWGWGLAVMLGVYCGRKSGGHLNPAVTLANCIYRGFPWRKLPIYAAGQILGCMAGAFVVYGNYRLAIDAFEGGSGIRTVTGDTATAGIFCTYPAEFLDRTAMVWSEFVASTILMFVIFALADSGNGNAQELMPLALFFLIFGIGACFGWQTGYAINLARDFGPRLVSYIVGYPSEVWSAGGYYFWIPMVIPFLGTTFGGFLYDTFMYTGDSPINKPYLGLTRIGRPKRSVWSNTYQAQQKSHV